jgi:hypothetical protein
MLAILFFILFLVYKLNNYALSLSVKLNIISKEVFLLLFLFRFLSLLYHITTKRGAITTTKIKEKISNSIRVPVK